MLLGDASSSSSHHIETTDADLDGLCIPEINGP